MVVLMPAATRQGWKPLQEGRLIDGMNKFTLLGSTVRGFEDGTASDEVGEGRRRRQLAEVPHSGGVRRCLFGVGEGPTEAVAEAKQDA